jgi:hypothetical protein
MPEEKPQIVNEEISIKKGERAFICQTRKIKMPTEQLQRMLADWDIVDYEDRLRFFDELSPTEMNKFLREEIRDIFIKIRELKEYLVYKKVINDDEFMKYLGET